MNATCFGSSCYGTARTSTYQSHSGAANLQAAAIGAQGVAVQQASVDEATPAMIDLTQKIDNYQYGYRRLRAIWISACPTLSFPTTGPKRARRRRSDMTAPVDHRNAASFDPTSNRIVDVLVAALKVLGGIGHLDEITTQCERMGYPHPQDSLRARLQESSSDAVWEKAQKPRNAQDLFYSLDGVDKATGIWGLRNFYRGAG